MPPHHRVVPPPAGAACSRLLAITPRSQAAEEPPAKKEKKEKKAKAEEAAEEAAPATSAATPAAEGEGGRVFLGNLPWSVTDEQIKEVFAKCGEITKIEWLTHADSGKFKGAGFLQFASAAAADAATKLNGNDLDGRAMKVEIATAKKERAGGAAGNSDPGEPSNSIFLGNLAWNIEEETVRAAFKDCGAISRIKWVEKDGEFRGIAFIDFESVEAATKAVALNGVDLGGRPARINFSKPREPRPADPNKPQRTYKPQKEKPEGCVELFIGNLPWSIDDDKITNFFKSAGTVTNVRWLNDRETQEFKGVGFVTFSSTEEVDKAVELAGESIDGRQIRIDYAGQKKEGNGGGNTWQKKW